MVRREPERGPFTTYFTTVAQVSALTGPMIRVTVRGGDLASFAPCGPDTFVYVLLPPAGSNEVLLDRDFTWEQYYAMPDDARPVGAYYTVRHWRPEVPEADIDVVVHAGGGTGERLAQSKPGTPIALWGPRFIYAARPTDEWQLLVGDETALPAIGAIIETTPETTRTIVVIEVATSADEIELAARTHVDVVWVHRGDTPAGKSDLLHEAVRALTLPSGPGYVWGGGESKVMTRIRKYVRHACGLDRDDVDVTAYWRHADHLAEEVARGIEDDE